MPFLGDEFSNKDWPIRAQKINDHHFPYFETNQLAIGMDAITATIPIEEATPKEERIHHLGQFPSEIAQ